jgi:hypothetical protein
LWLGQRTHLADHVRSGRKETYERWRAGRVLTRTGSQRRFDHFAGRVHSLKAAFADVPLDYFDGSQRNAGRHFEAKRLCGLEVEGHLNSGGQTVEARNETRLNRIVADCEYDGDRRSCCFAASAALRLFFTIAFGTSGTTQRYGRRVGEARPTAVAPLSVSREDRKARRFAVCSFSCPM